VARLLYSGRGRDAWALAHEIRPRPPLRDHTDDVASALYLSVSLETGEGWDELERWADELLAQGMRLGDTAATARGALTRGALCFWEGRFRDARRWLTEAELQLERRDSVGLLGAARSFLVGVACCTGDAEAAAVARDRFRSTIGADGPRPSQRTYTTRAEAWAGLAAGDSALAQEIFLRGADDLARSPLQAARMVYEAFRAGTPAADLAGLLERYAQQSDSPLTEACARHVTALADGDGPGLITAVDELEAIGARRYASEAAAHASSTFAREGRQDSARRAAVRSRSLFAEEQDGFRPVIDGVDGPSTELTRRERQLAELAASGLSNAEIADRLVLSVRTVESHLFKAMQKLGVGDRRAIASLIHQR
jgi:DNA-binding NarL/FixJ family response regulator